MQAIGIGSDGFSFSLDHKRSNVSIGVNKEFTRWGFGVWKVWRIKIGIQLFRMMIEIVECQRVELQKQGIGLGFVLGRDEIMSASYQPRMVGIVAELHVNPAIEIVLISFIVAPIDGIDIGTLQLLHRSKRGLNIRFESLHIKRPHIVP